MAGLGLGKESKVVFDPVTVTAGRLLPKPRQQEKKDMKIGLIGLPSSGKTSIFNALSVIEGSVTAYTRRKAKPHVAVVEVMDHRVTTLYDKGYLY